MKKIADFVLKHKKLVLVLFIVAVLVSIPLSTIVKVNFDLSSYLPDDAKSTIALDVMTNEFTKAPPNARVLVEDVNIPRTLEYKAKIKNVSGVEEVSWLDDAVDIYQPIEAIDNTLVETWYKDNCAVFDIVINHDKAGRAISEIKTIIGESGEITGEIVDTESAKVMAGSESTKMMIFIIPVILIILFLTTSSWLEPVLFLVAIGVSIIINNGTNAFLGEVSFITQTTSSILQLAVSMDYSIFLLHRFAEFRKDGLDVKEAMALAMEKSFSSILASGLTTILGFGALIFMRFKIGPDLGIVLAKGIVFSLVSVMLLLPVLTLLTYKLIDKTKHKSFLPSFNRFSKVAVRIGLPVLIVVGILIVPSFLAQNKNDFMYGASVMGSNSTEISKTDQLFGKANKMVVLVPKGNIVKEKSLSNELYALPYVSSIVSYTKTVGAVIPSEFLPKESLENMQSEKYSRIILTVTTSQESSSAFKAVEEVRGISEKYFGDTYHLVGGSANVYDMRYTVIQDNLLVTIVAIIGIGLVLLFTFKSLSLPIILVLTIESSIWINLAFPYFSGEKTAYIGFMIISAIQLGATVDYAILFASRYIENRRMLEKHEAARKTIADTAGSILTSASILMIAGFVMGFISTNGVIGQLGMLIGRGTLLSMVMVLFLLPKALSIFDKVIERTTLGAKFFKGGEKS